MLAQDNCSYPCCTLISPTTIDIFFTVLTKSKILKNLIILTISTRYTHQHSIYLHSDHDDHTNC